MIVKLSIRLKNEIIPKLSFCELFNYKLLEYICFIINIVLLSRKF